MIEQVRGLEEKLRAEPFTVHSGHRTHLAQHLAAVPAATNDAHLRPARALVIRRFPETEAPAQTRTHIPLARAARAVATDSGGAVVAYRVVVVVKASRDVVRPCRACGEDRTEAQRFRELEIRQHVEAVARVLQ